MMDDGVKVLDEALSLSLCDTNAHVKVLDGGVKVLSSISLSLSNTNALVKVLDEA